MIVFPSLPSSSMAGHTDCVLYISTDLFYDCFSLSLLSSFTVGTRLRSRTSHGIPTNPGSSVQYPRTTSCKSGRWSVQTPVIE